MKTNKLALIIFLSAMIVAVSCDIDNESPWPDKQCMRDCLICIYMM